MRKQHREGVSEIEFRGNLIIGLAESSASDFGLLFTWQRWVNDGLQD